MFYSKSTGGFYTPELHGPLRIKIIDPLWVRPVVSVDLQPGEIIEADGRTWTNTTDQGVSVTGVPDMSAIPPILEIDNPATKIPSDAVEITDERHRALLAGQAEGKRIDYDAQGYPILQDPPPPSANEIIYGQIFTLEQTITDRRIRESILGIDNGWLADVNAQIVTLRKDLS